MVILQVFYALYLVFLLLFSERSHGDLKPIDALLEKRNALIGSPALQARYLIRVSWSDYGRYQLPGAIMAEICGEEPWSDTMVLLWEHMKTTEIPTDAWGMVGQRLLHRPDCPVFDEGLALHLKRLGQLRVVSEFDEDRLEWTQKKQETIDTDYQIAFDYLTRFGLLSFEEKIQLAKAWVQRQVWFDGDGRIRVTDAPTDARLYGGDFVSAGRMISDALSSHEDVPSRQITDLYEYVTDVEFLPGYEAEVKAYDLGLALDYWHPVESVKSRLVTLAQQKDVWAYAYGTCLEHSDPGREILFPTVSLLYWAKDMGVSIQEGYLNNIFEHIAPGNVHMGRDLYEKGRFRWPFLSAVPYSIRCDQAIIDLDALH